MNGPVVDDFLAVYPYADTVVAGGIERISFAVLRKHLAAPAYREVIGADTGTGRIGPVEIDGGIGAREHDGAAQVGGIIIITFQARAITYRGTRRGSDGREQLCLRND